MDKSTITIVVGIIGLVVFFRWMFKGDSQHPSLQQAQQNDADSTISDRSHTSGVSGGSGEQGNGRTMNGGGQRRVVTRDMVEIVQNIGPYLTVDQIRYDLQKTGNVEETVNTFLRTGSLPLPPASFSGSASVSQESLINPSNAAAAAQNNLGSASSSSSLSTGNTSSRNQAGISGIDILKSKCHFSPDNLVTKYNVDLNKDYTDIDYSTLSLDERKQYMIWKARKGYEKSMHA